MWYSAIKISYLLSLLIVPIIIAQKKNPVSALAWIMATVFLPIVGPILYLIFGTGRIQNRGYQKMFSNARARKTLRKIETGWAASGKPRTEELPHELENIIQLCHRSSLFDAVTGNRVDILVDAEKTYQKMEDAILKAVHHINMDFYIFRPDKVGNRFRALLIKKAKEGVKVHLLYDAVGSLGLSLRHGFLNSLRKNGVCVQEFLPLRIFFMPWYMNLRNHRKVLIVDNKIAFAGSLNIGENFLNTKRRKWRETSVMVQGPAVAQLQWIFCEDWYTAALRMPGNPEYFVPFESMGDHIIQIVASGPDEREDAIRKAFFVAISSAKKSIYLTTPYFIPDEAFYLALQMAAARDVDVRLLVPHKSDHHLVLLAGRSYYDNLLKSGVRIYEFDAGILHAKMLIVDGQLAVIGSANADVRSFRYNFEVNVQVYSEEVAKQAEQVFFADLGKSVELTKSFLKRPARLRFVENVFRLLSPLL